MAFCNKVGSLLRHSVSQNGQASITSMLNSVRYMSSSKLFIGGITKCSYNILIIDNKSYAMTSLKLNLITVAFQGLSYSTDDQTLKDAFSGFGDVVEGEFFNILSW
jgi:hypothetical protein